jgi:hypothetical protein
MFQSLPLLSCSKLGLGDEEWQRNRLRTDESSVLLMRIKSASLNARAKTWWGSIEHEPFHSDLTNWLL